MAKSFPILYPADEVEFSSLGYGVMIDTISCEVTDERNKPLQYECVLQYPINGELTKYIKIDNIVRVFAHKSDTEREIFTIYYIDADTAAGILTVYARQSAWREAEQIVIGTCRKENSSPKEVMSYLLTQMPSGQTDAKLSFPTGTITSPRITFENTEPRTLIECLLGDKDSIFDKVGSGFWLASGRKIWLLSNMFQLDSNVVVKVGKNASSFNVVFDSSSVITGILPYWKKDADGVTNVVQGSICSASAMDTNRTQVVPVDVTSLFDSSVTPTAEQVTTAGNAYLAANYNGKIPITYSATLIDTPESSLDKVSIYSYVILQCKELGVNLNAKVVKTVYNPLSDKWISIEVGSASSTICETIKKLKE